jgi:hypothetical protein
MKTLIKKSAPAPENLNKVIEQRLKMQTAKRSIGFLGVEPHNITLNYFLSEEFKNNFYSKWDARQRNKFAVAAAGMFFRTFQSTIESNN